jgi:hypothetical protein
MVPGITSADAVTGPYDVIARARAATLEDLQRRIVPRMQAMDGIIRVLVSPIFTVAFGLASSTADKARGARSMQCP